MYSIQAKAYDRSLRIFTSKSGFGLALTLLLATRAMEMRIAVTALVSLANLLVGKLG
jgi:hypothetical protein